MNRTAAQPLTIPGTPSFAIKETVKEILKQYRMKKDQINPFFEIEEPKLYADTSE